MLKHDDDDDEERDDVVEDGCEDGLGKPYSSPTGQISQHLSRALGPVAVWAVVGPPVPDATRPGPTPGPRRSRL